MSKTKFVFIDTSTPEGRREATEAYRSLASALEGQGRSLDVGLFATALAVTMSARDREWDERAGTYDHKWKPDVFGLSEDNLSDDYLDPAAAEEGYIAALVRVVNAWQDGDREAAFRAGASAYIYRRSLHGERDRLNELVFPWTNNDDLAVPDQEGDVPNLFSLFVPEMKVRS